MKLGASDIVSFLIIIVILMVFWFLIKKVFFIGLLIAAVYFGYRMLAGSEE